MKAQIKQESSSLRNTSTSFFNIKAPWRVRKPAHTLTFQIALSFGRQLLDCTAERQTAFRALSGKAGKKKNLLSHFSGLRARTRDAQDKMGKYRAWRDRRTAPGEFIQRAEGLTCRVMSGSQCGFLPYLAGGRRNSLGENQVKYYHCSLSATASDDGESCL